MPVLPYKDGSYMIETKDSHSSDDNGGLLAARTEPLWTVKDVGEYLRLKPETVRMMARARKIPAIKVGKAWRFRASEIKEILNHR
jgi:excisionase family DNA binding protein